MSKLHMDVDSVRRAQRNIQQSKTTLSDVLAKLDGAVNSVIGYGWISGSANEFMSQYQEMRNQIVQEISRLEKMANDLDRQIRRWEAMAERLG